MAERQHGRRAIEVGPTARTVAQNVHRLRKARGLSVYSLSKALRTAGRSISPDAISKIESVGRDGAKHIRRMDVDDLMALAAVLNVSPIALLLPLDDDPNHTIAVTGAGEVPADVAWSWVSNERPLHFPEGDPLSAMLEHTLYSLPPGRRSRSRT